MQTLVPKVPLEVQKNRHFFVNHVYYRVVTLGHRSHHRSAVTWWPHRYRKDSQISRTPSLATQILGKKSFSLKKLERNPKSRL